MYPLVGNKIQSTKSYKRHIIEATLFWALKFQFSQHVDRKRKLGFVLNRKGQKMCRNLT